MTNSEREILGMCCHGERSFYGFGGKAKPGLN